MYKTTLKKVVSQPGSSPLAPPIRDSSEPIGKGTGNRVYPGHNLTGTPVAIYSPLAAAVDSKGDPGLNLLKTLNHTHILKVVSTRYRTTELCVGNLQECKAMLDANPPAKIDKPSVLYTYLKQTVEALKYLHDSKIGIAHRDIKPQNLFLHPSGGIRLGDFGEAAKVTHTGRPIWVGSVPYVAPEVMASQTTFPTLPASDVWSLGVVAAELVHGEAPPVAFFKQFSIRTPDLLSFVTSTITRYVPHLQAKREPADRSSLDHLVYWMMRPVPSERYTMEQVAAHPYFRRPGCSEDVLRAVANQLDASFERVADEDTPGTVVAQHSTTVIGLGSGTVVAPPAQVTVIGPAAPPPPVAPAPVTGVAAGGTIVAP